MKNEQHLNLKAEGQGNLGIDCHKISGDVLVFCCATVCAQLPNCKLKRDRETIEGEKLGEMNHLKEQNTER